MSCQVVAVTSLACSDGCCYFLVASGWLLLFPGGSGWLLLFPGGLWIIAVAVTSSWDLRGCCNFLVGFLMGCGRLQLIFAP